MAFNSFYDFLVMGGQAKFVWSAYGITFIVMLMNIITPLRKHRRCKIKLTTIRVKEEEDLVQG